MYVSIGTHSHTYFTEQYEVGIERRTHKPFEFRKGYRSILLQAHLIEQQMSIDTS